MTLETQAQLLMDHILKKGTKDDCFLRLRLETIEEELHNGAALSDVDKKFGFDLKKFGDAEQVRVLANYVIENFY